MLHYLKKAGSTDVSVIVRVIDATDGTPETGVAYDTAGIDLQYRREGSTSTAITEATLAGLDSAHSDGGFKHIGNGYCRLDLPDAACAAGASGVLVHGTITGMVVIGCYIQLLAVDLQDGVRAGLTALPNAAADAAGGLPISDDGGLDMDLLAGIGVAGAGLTALPPVTLADGAHGGASASINLSGVNLGDILDRAHNRTVALMGILYREIAGLPNVNYALPNPLTIEFSGVMPADATVDIYSNPCDLGGTGYVVYSWSGTAWVQQYSAGELSESQLLAEFVAGATAIPAGTLTITPTNSTIYGAPAPRVLQVPEIKAGANVEIAWRRDGTPYVGWAGALETVTPAPTLPQIEASTVLAKEATLGTPAGASLAADIAAVKAAVGTAGTGVTVTLTIQDALLNPIANCTVWITSDIDGDTVVSGPKETGDAGTVAFLLTAGVTYYCWRRKSGMNFTNPSTFVAVAD